MEFRQVKIQNSLLREGETYVFLLTGEIETGNGKASYVFQDPFGYKMLVPMGFYQGYGFRVGQEVVCKVDKISCSGKMYLEPRHPHYQEGKQFEFGVMGLVCKRNLADLEEWHYRVRDCLGKEWLVRTEKGAGFPDFVKCLVSRIRKGNLHLKLSDLSLETTGLKQGMTYSFKIIDQKKIPEDGMSCFILEDEEGSRHILRKKHYHRYGLKVGQTIRCRVDGTLDEGSPFLEPEHPKYEIGKEYPFSADRLEEYVFYNGTSQKMVVLKDVFGEEIRVHLNETEAAQWGGYEKLVCRVKGIRKSRVEVEILEGVNG